MGARRYWVKNFGCRATQADGAALEADLRVRGLEPARSAAEADVVVVNTCTVTAEADRDARQTIRRLHRENPAAEIIATGCYAQRRPEELRALPGVRWVVGNSHKTAIGSLAAPLVTIAGAPAALDYHGGVLIGDIRTQRELLTAPVIDAGQDRSRPNVKVQDGCNNRCSFCVIPSVRGFSRSAPAEQVLSQLRALERQYPEIVLTGVNLGRWGRDLPGRPRFPALLRRILGETAVRKIRLSSVEPMDWSDELLELAASEPRIAKHVHAPLQSASDRVLRAMRRRYRIRHYADRLERAWRLMPSAGIGADVLVGFPGETEAEFDETRRYIERAPFTYLHVFTYSARQGTPAASAPDQVPKAVKKERNRVLRELAARKGLEFRRSLIGRRFDAVTLAGGRALLDNFLDVRLKGAAPGPARAIEVYLEDTETARLARLDS